MIVIDTKERWRPVAGFEGLYEVSNLGRIRTPIAAGGKRAGRIKAIWKHSRGEPYVTLCAYGFPRSEPVKRLVREAFPEATP